MVRFKPARQCQRFILNRGQIGNLLHLHRKYRTATDNRQLRAYATTAWWEIAVLIEA